MDSHFLNTENHSLLYELVRNNINQSMGIDIDQSKKNFKKGLNDVMQNVYKTNKNKKNISLNSLNKETLNKCLPFFTKHLKNSNKTNENRKHNKYNNNENIRSKAMPIRDAEFGEKKTPFVNLRPEFSNNSRNTDINEVFNKIRDDREINNEVRLPPREFSLPDKLENEKDPLDMYEKESKLRENQINTVPIDNPFMDMNEFNRNNIQMQVNRNNQSQSELKKNTYISELEEYKNNLNKNNDNPDMFNTNLPNQINEIEPKIMTKTNITSIKVPKEIEEKYNQHQNNIENFSNEQEKFIEKDKEFEERLKKIESEREINFFNNLNENSDNNILKNELMPKTNWETNYNDNSIFNDRNKITEEIRFHNENTKDEMNKQIIIREDEIKEELENRNKNELNVKYEDIVQKINNDTKIVQNNITISSIDRDIVEFPDRYNYMVRFSPAVDEWIKFPIYENNKTIAATNEQAENGIKGDPNPNYDEKKPPGNIIGQESILYKGSRSASIQKIFRNIHSIELKYIIFHVDQLMLHLSKKLITNILSYPYLLLQIKEIDGIVNGTSDQLDKSFAQIVPARDYCHSKVTSTNNTVSVRDSGFIHYIPTNGTGKFYFPTPLSILDRLTIKIVNPYGEELVVQKDIVNISKLSYITQQNLTIYDSSFKESHEGSTNNKEIIEITLDKYVKAQCFDVGKIIKISNIENIDGDSNWTESEKLNFLKFINRKDGHISIGVFNNIIQQNNNDPILYTNKIYIQNAFDYNNINNFKPETHTWVPDTLNFAINLDIDSDKKPNLINMSMQNSFVFELSTNEIDSTTILYGQNQ